MNPTLINLSSWTDYQLETVEYLQVFSFPFRSEEKPRVVRNVLRIILLYGYEVGKDLKIRLVKPLQRKELGLYTGLYSMGTCRRIKPILQFLYLHNLHKLITIFGKVLKHAYEHDRQIAVNLTTVGVDSLLDTNNFVKLQPLLHINNSCYADSVLTALLAPESTFIDEVFFMRNSPRPEVQQELLRIRNYIRGEGTEENCNAISLRKLLNFSSGEMQDAGEFTIKLLDALKIEVMRKSRITYVTNARYEYRDLTETFREIQRCIPVIPVFLSDQKDIIILENCLKNVEDSVLQNPYIDKRTQKVYRRRVETSKVTQSTFIIFNVQRLTIINNQEERLYNSINIPKRINIGPFMLRLLSIVTHEGYHYTCYFNYRDVWYFYDDMRGIDSIGTYEKMLKREPSVERYGVLYVYG